jgi:hypothetical protein
MRGGTRIESGICVGEHAIVWTSAKGGSDVGESLPFTNVWVETFYRWLKKTKVDTLMSFAGLPVLPAFARGVDGAITYRSLLAAPELAPCMLRRPVTGASQCVYF